jgi:hypothetical protein
MGDGEIQIFEAFSATRQWVNEDVDAQRGR